MANQENNQQNQTEEVHYKGVSKEKSGNYRARIRVYKDGISTPTHIGMFKTSEEAARAYDSVSFAIYGHKSSLNFHDTTETVIIKNEKGIFHKCGNCGELLSTVPIKTVDKCFYCDVFITFTKE